MPIMTNNLFKKAACFTDIHWGTKEQRKTTQRRLLRFC